METPDKETCKLLEEADGVIVGVKLTAVALKLCKRAETPEILEQLKNLHKKAVQVSGALSAMFERQKTNICAYYYGHYVSKPRVARDIERYIIDDELCAPYELEDKEIPLHVQKCASLISKFAGLLEVACENLEDELREPYFSLEMILRWSKSVESLMGEFPQQRSEWFTPEACLNAANIWNYTKTAGWIASKERIRDILHLLDLVLIQANGKYHQMPECDRHVYRELRRAAAELRK